MPPVISCRKLLADNVGKQHFYDGRTASEARFDFLGSVSCYPFSPDVLVLGQELDCGIFTCSLLISHVSQCRIHYRTGKSASQNSLQLGQLAF